MHLYTHIHHHKVLDSCIPLICYLLPSLRQGAVVLADDVTLFPDDVATYLDFVRDPANGFVTATLPLGDGIEYSVKL
jgi:predicted O-methyltransferase YrrM